MNDIRQIAFTNELRFARPREQVFEAFIQSEKWFQVVRQGPPQADRARAACRRPDLRGLGRQRGRPVRDDRLVGSPRRLLSVSGMLGGGITLNHRYEFEEDGDATVLRHRFSAFGPISDEIATGIQWHGSLETWEDQLHLSI